MRHAQDSQKDEKLCVREKHHPQSARAHVTRLILIIEVLTGLKMIVDNELLVRLKGMR